MSGTDLVLKYVSPFERQYSDYNEHLIAFNRELQKKISENLLLLLKNCKGSIAVATVGSDARLEKGPNSQLELVLLHESNFAIAEAQEILYNYISTENNKLLFSPDIELKNIDEQKLYESKLRTSTNGEIKLISPNRIFDMRMLFEKDNLYNKLKQRFVEEMKLSEGKSLLKKIKEKFKEHSEVSVLGVQNYKGDSLVHYDFCSGFVNYNPEKNRWSFKQGPLRTVQYAIVRDSIKKIREGSNLENIFRLPKNTVEKLNRIEVEEITPLSVSEIGDLTGCYKYFLHLYHKSHVMYRDFGDERIRFDVQEAEEKCKEIVDICSGRIIS